MFLSKISESRSAPMSLEIIQCRKHVFPVDPEGIFPRTKDRRVQAALPYQQQAVVHIGGKIRKKVRFREDALLISKAKINIFCMERLPRGLWSEEFFFKKC